jgi:hypothetical protein
MYDEEIGRERVCGNCAHYEFMFNECKISKRKIKVDDNTKCLTGSFRNHKDVIPLLIEDKKEKKCNGNSCGNCKCSGK